jgi:hypothetical protein
MPPRRFSPVKKSKSPLVILTELSGNMRMSAVSHAGDGVPVKFCCTTA